MRRGILVVDIFSGAGGFGRGFYDVGFHVALAVDNDRACARTYAANIASAVVLNEDVRDLSCDDLRYLVGDDVDVVIGSPPCEPFTGANPRRRGDPLDRLYSDPIGSLVLNFIEFLSCLKPKVFIMENVPAILDGDLKEALRREFNSVGYHKIYFNILKAEDYSNPSRRTRVFISNIALNPQKKVIRATVWDAIKDLPEPSEDPVIPNHETPPRISDRKMKRVSRLKWGMGLIKYEGAGGRLMPNLIKLNPYETAPTVLGCSRFIHPFESRLLTVREQARLMGFPDDHVFLGGRDEQYNQVGEAVPYTLARVLAEEVLKYLTVG